MELRLRQHVSPLMPLIAFSAATIYLPSLLSSASEGIGRPGPQIILTFFGSIRLCPLGSLNGANALVRWQIGKIGTIICG